MASTYESEGTRYERFKFDYEYVKIQLEYNLNHESLAKFFEEYNSHLQKTYFQPYRENLAFQERLNLSGGMPSEEAELPKTNLIFEPYQQAELLRLIGEYYLKVGNLAESQKKLKESLALNKREAKTWLSFARLN